MFNEFGYVLLPKDTILYHTTDEEFIYRPEKPMLFCTFHPSEWENLNRYVVTLKLKKDLKVLFMISGFKKHYIYSSLDKINNYDYLSKQRNNKLINLCEKLKLANLDGWLSSIENKSYIEVALINNPNFYEHILFNVLYKNWRNGNNLNNILSLKNWGKKYEISTLQNPLTFYVPNNYRKMLEEYKKYGETSRFPKEYALQVILENAKIKALFLNGL